MFLKAVPENTITTTNMLQIFFKKIIIKIKRKMGKLPNSSGF
jgi:hypothetical protein